VHKLFVYGTLLRGRPAHLLLEKSKFAGRAVARHLALYGVDEQFPGAVPETGSHVLGELYEVDGRTLAVLDDYEGEEFYRCPVEVDLESGEVCKAWVYLWAGRTGGARRVPLKEQPWKCS